MRVRARGVRADETEQCVLRVTSRSPSACLRASCPDPQAPSRPECASRL